MKHINVFDWYLLILDVNFKCLRWPTLIIFVNKFKKSINYMIKILLMLAKEGI